MTQQQGVFITFDGIDGTGKSTQIAAAQAWLETQGFDVVLTREPGGTDLGEALRALLLDKRYQMQAKTETLMMFAARAEHIHQVIAPALAQQKVVISDRFTDATYAYQCGGRGLDIDDVAFLENWVQQALRPDLTFILDAPFSLTAPRIDKTRDKDRFEAETQAFFERTRVMYQRRAKADSTRCLLMDANAPPEVISAQVVARLKAFFAKRQQR